MERTSVNFTDVPSFSENYIGEPIAFEWKIFQGSTASKLLQKNQKTLKDNASDLKVSLIE